MNFVTNYVVQKGFKGGFVSKSGHRVYVKLTDNDYRRLKILTNRSGFTMAHCIRASLRHCLNLKGIN